MVTRALDYLDKRDPSTPFFLNLSFFPPHPPLAPSRDFFERYAALDLPEPVIGDWVEPVPPGASRGLDPVGGQQRLNLDPLTMHYCRAAYYGLINEIDSQLGRLFNAIRGSLLANTFVIFVSDHGEMLGDHHRFAKTEPFEASARIPFMAMAPQPGRSRTNAEFPSGLSCDAPVGLQDVMPTLLDVAGVPIPPGVTGRSLVPFMRGEQPDWRDALHGEHCGYRSYDNGTHWLVSRTRSQVHLVQPDRAGAAIRSRGRSQRAARSVRRGRPRTLATTHDRGAGGPAGRVHGWAPAHTRPTASRVRAAFDATQPTLPTGQDLLYWEASSKRCWS